MEGGDRRSPPGGGGNPYAIMQRQIGTFMLDILKLGPSFGGPWRTPCKKVHTTTPMELAARGYTFTKGRN